MMATNYVVFVAGGDSCVKAAAEAIRPALVTISRELSYFSSRSVGGQYKSRGVGSITLVVAVRIVQGYFQGSCRSRVLSRVQSHTVET